MIIDVTSKPEFVEIIPTLNIDINITHRKWKERREEREERDRRFT